MIWWLVFKIIGIVMMIIGGLMVVLGPGVPSHQEVRGSNSGTNFGLSAIVIGIILIVVGGFILFSP
ncbi:MAG: hypothetical protein KAS04_02070 [Candidatus Aenigmarchaeota archaeon]|nr:hypothetical protein [Candidatus Aenigmarchaeota archaeon]